MIIGIDFGAKKVGSTVIARLFEYNKVDFFSSSIEDKSDLFILNFIKENSDVWLAYIDAPISLPLAFKNKTENGDHLYREADKATGADSPMLLGDLTTRAIKLNLELTKMGVKVVETYPNKLANVLKLNELNYKKDSTQIATLCEVIKKKSGFTFDNDEVKTWHHFDALLCLYSAKRHEMQAAMVFGNAEEGTITV